MFFWIVRVFKVSGDCGGGELSKVAGEFATRNLSGNFSHENRPIAPDVAYFLDDIS
jgi:hypothetical protein